MSQKGLSYTAWLVMTCQLALKNDSRWQMLVPDESAEFYRRAHVYCQRVSQFFRLISFIPPHQHAWILDTIFARGMAQHYALRKKAIRAQTEECIRLGVEQIVILGGGFDLLALTLANQYPNVVCFELDMPAMCAHKSTIVHEYQHSLPSNYYSIGADLARAPLDEVLLGLPSFDENKSTLFIAEGVSMYLTAAQIDRLFQSFRRASARKASVLFTAVEQHQKAQGRLATWICQILLALRRERMAWSMERGRMPEFLRAGGFVQRKLISYADLQRPWREAQEMQIYESQKGEYVVYAQKA